MSDLSSPTGARPSEDGPDDSLCSYCGQRTRFHPPGESGPLCPRRSSPRPVVFAGTNALGQGQVVLAPRLPSAEDSGAPTDTQRLDWFERVRPDVTGVEWSDGRWHRFKLEDEDGKTLGLGTTIREAIDAALRAAAPSPDETSDHA